MRKTKAKQQQCDPPAVLYIRFGPDDRALYEYVRDQAAANRRTLVGQALVMLQFAAAQMQQPVE